MPRRVRIRLHRIPPVLRDVLCQAAAGHDEIEVVDDAAAGADEVAEVVLAVTTDPYDSAGARALLFASRATRVALLTPAGRELVIYDFSSHPVAAVDLQASELLEAVSRAVPDDPGAR